MAKRMITTEFTQEDEKIETGLRPQYLKRLYWSEESKKTI